MTPPASPMYADGASPIAEKSREFMRAANGLSTVFTLGDLEAQLYELLEGDFGEDMEVTQEQAAIALVDSMIVEKVEGYVSVIRNLERMAEARKAESDRLRDRAQTAQKHADWLKVRLLTHLQVTGRQRVETSRFSITVRQNPPSVTVLDASAVPGEFQRTKIEVTVDKRGILDAFRATGEIPPGVEVSRTESLRIA